MELIWRWICLPTVLRSITLSRKKLIVHAMEILETGPTVLDDRIAHIWNEETLSIFQEELRSRLGKGDMAAALAGWKLLFALCGAASSDVFVSTARAMWPKDQNVGLKIVSALGSNISPIPP